MINKALQWSLLLVVLLSVLFPVGAYFGTVLVFVYAIEARKSRQIIFELSKDKAVLFMVFAVLLSVINSGEKLISIGGAALVCLNAGLYLVLTVELRDIKLKKYYNMLNLACLLACIYGIYQFASGNLKLEKSWVDINTFGAMKRVYSTLYNPNIFAAYLSMNLSFGLASFRSLREDILLSCNIILSSICLLLTYSRGGFLALAAAMLTLCLLKKQRLPVAIYFTVMTAAFFSLNSAGSVSRAGLEGVCRDSSSLYRLEIWRAAVNVFFDHPIFGSGVGTSWYYLSGSSDKLFKYILHSHNIYLHTAAELGIVGLCAFIGLLADKVLKGFRLLRTKPSEENECILQGFIACTAGIAAHGLIDAVIFVPGLSLIFMGYSALYARAAEGCSKELPEAVVELAGQRTKPTLLFDGKGILKLFGSKGACQDKYKEEEKEAYQA